ncbi:MAG: glutamate-5-semialdehyde dehydrogenase [Acholeplasmatales bacterium]|nr:glutamate-5-semialdehyde dehydrogenase [Acholeplasmatales bacterium]
MDSLLNSCKLAQKELLKLSNENRNKCLENISKALKDNIKFILEENEKDINNAKANGISSVMVDRLKLDEKRLNNIADSVIDVMNLKDYIGEVIEEFNPENGLNIKKIRVPFGVICAIFESRPNVSVDITALTIKTANACVLKGGKEAINTNKALVKVMRNAICDIVNPDIITLIESTDRKTTDELITKKEYIDLLIPRGSKRLINYIVENSKVPYIETGAGNCTLYVHEDAKLHMALNVCINAKHQRPSVCNAIENIIVDKKIAANFLPELKQAFETLTPSVEIRGDKEVQKIIDCKPATDEDYYTEYNDYIVSVKIVDGVDSAIEFINEHSTKHSEAIITEDMDAVNKFFTEVDSACLYHNASTRFTDGGEFGFGAEIGISTTKLHARGPMGLREITTYKYIISGNGSVRK